MCVIKGSKKITAGQRKENDRLIVNRLGQKNPKPLSKHDSELKDWFN